MLKKVAQIFLLVVLSVVFLASCQQKDAKKAQVKTVIAKKETATSQLFFNGMIEPIKTNSVLSPVNGRVSELYFSYGERITKEQKLISLDSSELAENYRKAVTDYLQKKNDYSNAVESFQGSLALFRAKVISEEEFSNAKSTYETSILNFYQARFALEKILNRARIDPKEIEMLTLSDTSAINKILQRRFSHLVVYSTATGIALFPIQGDSGGGSNGDGKQAKLAVGVEVKLGQLILSIGNLSGLAMQLQVGETNINRIKPGQKVTITGSAFPYTLQGVVESVASQANPQTGSDSAASFNVRVVVPNITEAQRKVIHVGMTAKAEIDIKQPPQIILPINAVYQKNGQSYVTIIGKDGSKKEVAVTTGDTTPTSVIILSGVNEGDKVVIND